MDNGSDVELDMHAADRWGRGSGGMLGGRRRFQKVLEETGRSQNKNSSKEGGWCRCLRSRACGLHVQRVVIAVTQGKVTDVVEREIFVVLFCNLIVEG